MTTKVTVDAHAGYDISVSVYELANGANTWNITRVEKVEAGTQRDFYIHQHLYISVVENPSEPEATKVS